MFLIFFFLAGEALFKTLPRGLQVLRLTQRRGGEKEEKIDLFPLSLVGWTEGGLYIWREQGRSP